MANTERGGSIREYIDARKKGGMTWDEFRKLKSEVDGPQFSEYELVQYRQQLDDERDAKLKGVSGSSSSKKKKKKHHHHHHHRRRHRSSSHDRDYKRKRSKSDGRLTRGSKSHSPIGNRNFSEDGYYEDYEKRRMDDEDVLDVEKERHDRHSKRKERSSSIEPGAYESSEEFEDKKVDEDNNDDENKDKKHHHHHHRRHSHKKHKHRHKVQEEEHTGDTPVRLSEFLKHGSSSSDE